MENFPKYEGDNQCTKPSLDLTPNAFDNLDIPNPNYILDLNAKQAKGVI